MALSMDKVADLPAVVPPAAPLPMPKQDLRRAPEVRFRRPGWQTRIARVLTFGGALALTSYAAYQMILVVSIAQITSLQWFLVVLYTITFGWIALAACGAISGVFFGRKKARAGATLKASGRTVLLMPVYNEDPARTFSALQAMGEELASLGAGDNFELFVISDTTNPDVWIKETAAFQRLRAAMAGKMHVWYRRRFDNRAKKAGNVEEFVKRWGGRYDHMIVLDADSILAAGTLVALVAEMEADPASGIIQSLPRLHGSPTLFGRLQQFASAVYGPVVARSITAWQGHDGNYWGHNAIIRVRAFAEAAGLPVLSGRKPFGGDIMSHDFVEAALIRRAGWRVSMLPDLEGSWEESPPTLLDVAARDRRWAQGNLQHMNVISTRGLRWPNRMHMLIGVMSYLASPLWLLLIITGLAITGQVATQDFNYFGDGLTLFPLWPVFDSERMIELFLLTMAVLLLPKMLGLLETLVSRKKRRQMGVIRPVIGVVVETFFSVLYAPIFMLMQTQHLWEIVRGHDSGWSVQQREYRGFQWKTLIRRHGWHMLAGIGVAFAVGYVSLPMLAWLSPTLVGLALAVPLSALSGSTGVARALRFFGLLVIPEEASTPSVMLRQARVEKDLRQAIISTDLHALLANDAAARLHFASVLPAPSAPRGRPDVPRLVVAEKLADAESLDEALAWLEPAEIRVVLADQRLFALLQRLHRHDRYHVVAAYDDERQSTG